MTDTIKIILADILGTYSPSGSGIAEMDWEYIASAAVFIVFLWFTFSFIRTFFCGVMNRRW